MIVVPVELEAGFHQPDGVPARGRTVTVPATAESVVLAAEADDQLSVRIGTEGDPGAWVELANEAEEGPDRAAAEGKHGEGSLDGLRALPPLLVEGGADRLEIVRLGEGGGEVSVAFLEARDVSGNPLVAGVQQVSSGAPTIVPRSGWIGQGWASGKNGCSSGPWYADNLQAIVVHHTVTANSYSADQVDDLLRAIHYGHVEVNGWCDIAYNFLVDRFGTIWEGRSGGTDRPVIGGHAKGFNTGTVGVALLGQHQQGARPAAGSPSTAALSAVSTLATWKLGLHGIDPLGTTWLENGSTTGRHRLAPGQWHRVPTVLGHQDLGLTSCPGSLSLNLVRGIGPTVAASTGANEPHQLAGWTAYDHGPGFVVVGRHGNARVAGSAAIPGMGLPPSPSSVPAAQPSPSAVAVATVGQGATIGGYVLHADGVLHSFGSAPGVVERPAGDAPPVDLALAGPGEGGWVMAATGGVHGFGGRTDQGSTDPSAPAIIRGDLTPTGDGYLLQADGGLRAMGAAAPNQIAAAVDAIDLAVRPAGDSGWVLAADGSLHPFGGAPAAVVDSPGGLPRGLEMRAIAASDSGLGGWVLSSDGQLWAFGAERLILPLATDTAGRGAVDVAATGSYLPPSFLTADQARYLDGLVQLFLGRPARGGEIDYWDGWMTYRGGRGPVAAQLAQSAEWAGRSIQNMYTDVLGRPADPGGLDYWLDQIRRGVSVQDIGVYFYGSSEYVAAGGSSAGYVERLYDRLLSRRSDPPGLAYWSGQLDSGRAKPSDVAAAFYSSIESRNQRVRSLYVSVLGRGPDSAGAAHWAQRLGEVDDVILAAELATSDEFYLRTLK